MRVYDVVGRRSGERRGRPGRRVGKGDIVVEVRSELGSCLIVTIVRVQCRACLSSFRVGFSSASTCASVSTFEWRVGGVFPTLILKAFAVCGPRFLDFRDHSVVNTFIHSVLNGMDDLANHRPHRPHVSLRLNRILVIYMISW